MPIAHLPGGLQMHYFDDNFTDPWKKPETVILHHGNSKNARMWFGWVPFLARDYRVIRLDARGFGDSSVPEPGYRWSLEGFADDLRNLLDYLEIDQAHVIGESVGGTIAMQFAYQHPDRLRTATACMSPFRFAGDPMFLNYHRMVEEHGVEYWVRSHQFFETPEHTEWHVRQMSRTPRHVVLETLAAVSTLDISPVLQQIRRPAMVMVGERDERSTERAREMAALIPGCHLEVIEGTARPHYIVPEESVARWRRFASAQST